MTLAIKYFIVVFGNPKRVIRWLCFYLKQQCKNCRIRRSSKYWWTELLTFCPRHLPFSQLYILSFMYEERAYPFGFVFMEKRDSASYDCLFTNLKSLWAVDVSSKVVRCMSDYERAIRKILRAHFPNARISGWVFRFNM